MVNLITQWINLEAIELRIKRFVAPPILLWRSSCGKLKGLVNERTLKGLEKYFLSKDIEIESCETCLTSRVRLLIENSPTVCVTKLLPSCSLTLKLLLLSTGSYSTNSIYRGKNIFTLKIVQKTTKHFSNCNIVYSEQYPLFHLKWLTYCQNTVTVFLIILEDWTIQKFYVYNCT